MNVGRKPENTFHTKLSEDLSREKFPPLEPEEIQRIRVEIQNQLSQSQKV